MERALKIVVALVVALAMSQPAAAGTCSVTNLPTSGTITGSRLNARYNQIESCINGGIGDANIDTTDPITTSSLASPNSLYAVSFTVSCTAGTKAAAFKPVVASTIVGMSAHVDATGVFDYDVVLKKDASTVATDAAITTATSSLTSGLSTSVATTEEVIFDITQNTAGTCTAVNVVVFLTAAHQS